MRARACREGRLEAVLGRGKGPHGARLPLLPFAIRGAPRGVMRRG